MSFIVVVNPFEKIGTSIERKAKCDGVRHVAAPKPRIVRRDEPPPVCERMHEVAELKRGRRVSMRQQDERSVFRAGFA
jgi:hypothetical protein